jgi:fructokinase
VIRTKGEEGADGYTKSGTSAYVRTPEIEIADTVGAGDTFLAATLAYLHHQELLAIKRLGNLTREQLKACLSYASQAAAINCARVGANPPYKHELEKING